MLKSYSHTSAGQIHYRFTLKRSSDLPVVLLHQTASSSVMYEAVMKLLADTYWLVAPDTPGFGESFTPLEQPSIKTYANAIYEWLQTLDIKECWLFGHHTGAAIAVQLVHEHPPLARKLILSGPPYLNEKQKQTLAAKVGPLRLQENGSHLINIWERILSREPDLPLPLVHRECLLTLQARNHYLAYQAVFEQDFAAQLKTIACPTLVMAGNLDTIAESVEPTFNALPNAAMSMIPDAGTYICDQQPAVVAAILKEFFV